MSRPPEPGPVDVDDVVDAARPVDERAGRARVRVLSLALYASAVVAYVFVFKLDTSIEPPFQIPFVLLTVAFYVTEVRVVHLQFRREAQAFSLSEIPFVLGLFFASPAVLVLANLTGVAAALIIHRKQRDLKLLFNTGQVWLSASLAALAFQLVLHGQDPLSAWGFTAALVAASLGSAVNVVSILAAIMLSEGRAHAAKLPQVLGFAMMATLTTTSLALIGVLLLWERVAWSWLMLVPATSLYLASRAYTSQKSKHESLELLYESSRILHEYPEVEEAMAALLTQARETFRCEFAEITLFPADAGDASLRTSISSGPPIHMAPVAESAFERGFSEVSRRGASLRSIVADDVGVELHGYLEARGLRDAMLVPLRGETRIMGAMLLGNRLGQVSSFREEELPLFQTLANNASVSLENGRLEKTLSRLTELKEELRHQAFHDNLTGLTNRSMFNQLVDEAVRDRRQPPGTVAVMFLDLDDFKTVNDTLGHKAGDQLLVEVSKRLQECLRPQDTAARLGGDEFAVLLVGDDPDEHPEITLQVGDRILKQLGRPVVLDEKDLSVKASIGIAVTTAGDTAEDVVRNADVAMYEAKQSGKGCYALFEEGMRESIVERLRLRTDLLRGVGGSEFVVHFQPLVDLNTEVVIGAEALVRWQHPERGLVLPGEFIDVAEETGIVLPIGQVVLEKACQAAAAWERDHGPDLVVTINLSARELKHPSLLRTVTNALETSGVTPNNVVLEITERDIMDDTEANLHTLHALKGLGVQLAIDDFGTGYSSLAYLRRFPVDIVKVAQPFVDSLLEGDGILAHAIIELSHALGMRTIAEGIEVRSQAEALKRWDCEIGQGFLWSRALDGAGIDAVLRDGTPPDDLSLVANAPSAPARAPGSR